MNLRTHILRLLGPKTILNRLLGYFDAQGKSSYEYTTVSQSWFVPAVRHGYQSRSSSNKGYAGLGLLGQRGLVFVDKVWDSASFP